MKKGYIQLTSETFSFDKVGDILKVHKFVGRGAYVLNKDLPRPSEDAESNYMWCYLEDSYKKLENYKGENKMKKKDLKENDIVTLRNGDRLILCGGEFHSVTGEYNCIDDIDDYDDELMCNFDEDYDIIKVERPEKYETVFEREEVKEMTVDEISKKLGYKVKVVGEDR